MVHDDHAVLMPQSAFGGRYRVWRGPGPVYGRGLDAAMSGALGTWPSLHDTHFLVSEPGIGLAVSLRDGSSLSGDGSEWRRLTQRRLDTLSRYG